MEPRKLRRLVSRRIARDGGRAGPVIVDDCEVGRLRTDPGVAPGYPIRRRSAAMSSWIERSISAVRRSASSSSICASISRILASRS